MVGPIPLPLVIVAVVVLLFIFIQTKTTLGRFLFVIGGNRTSALLSGVKVNRTVTIMYTVTGFLAGLCGVIFVSRIGTGPPKIGTGFEFDVIVAVVLGGTSIYGGEGSVLGMVLGALIIGFVANGFNLLDIHSFYQTLFKGAVLVTAILLDQSIKRRFA
jgi:ribose/xylose/arabinose/galactoside ABC-type transport system permease subunit